MYAYHWQHLRHAAGLLGREEGKCMMVSHNGNLTTKTIPVEHPS